MVFPRNSGQRIFSRRYKTKTIYSLLFLIFSFWISSSQAQCQPDWYALYCRGGGGFTLKNTNSSGTLNLTDVGGKFKKNPYSYTRFGGKGIQPGNCAWFDRTLNESEPTDFRLSVYLNVMSTQVSMNLLTQCVPNANCWFTFCAHNYGVGYLSIYGVDMSATFGAAPP